MDVPTIETTNERQGAHAFLESQNKTFIRPL